jgi:hypothetical protein
MIVPESDGIERLLIIPIGFLSGFVPSPLQLRSDVFFHPKR